MAEIKKYIAVDLGAESGRVILGSVSTEKLELQEIHRFGNGAVEQSDGLHWDFQKLLSEIKIGIAKAYKASSAQIWGIGIDTWGVDFGLLDGDGNLIQDPFHYRDSRTDDMMEKAFELMPKRQIYENSGIQFMQINTLYQLFAMRQSRSIALAKAQKLIFVAELFAYYLCGKAYSEYTLASTSQMMDMKTGLWSEEIFDKLSLPISIMPEIVPPGMVVGQLLAELGREIKCGPIPIIAVGSHDTACAVAAVPASKEENWAYLSSGTWSLCGVEVPEAIINDKTFEHGFTNEGGVDNTIRLLKNIMGLWLVQECKRQWEKEGDELNYTQITEMAENAKPFAGSVDPDSGEFFAPGEMPKKVTEYLARTGQAATDDKGQIVRIILESLAFKTRWALERIEDVTGKKIDCLHIVGGGIQNELLCQFTANATGKKVITGPVEATASGNILTQARATGQLESLWQARKIVRNSFDLKEYQPQDVDLWNKQYKKSQIK